MDNEIEVADSASALSVLANAQPAKFASEQAFDKLAAGGKWLPRLQLFGGNSDAAKEGKIPMGTYGIVVSKDSITPLGPELDVLVLSWRPKAMDVGGDDVITNYNPESAQFKEIAGRSTESDSGCMFGPEFLVYIPHLRKYTTFMMGSKSSRREAPNLKAILQKFSDDGTLPAATLKITLITGKKYKWHNPVITRCSTPFDLPSDSGELQRVISDFNNPEESVVEKLSEVETADANRAR